MISSAVAVVDVQVDGRSLDADVRRRVVSVRVASRLSQPTQCEFTFVTGWGAAAEHEACPLGAAVTLQVGGEPDLLFEGEVTAVEVVHGPDGETLVRVRAYDRLHRLRKRQEVRAFESVTVADLARQLTGDLGVDVVADDPGPRLERLVQHRQRDLELLVDVAARAGLHVLLRGDELTLVTLEGTGETVPLDLGDTLLEARVEANLDRVGRAFTAYGWHPQRAESYEERVASARNGRWIDLDPDLDAVHVKGDLTLVDQPGRDSGEVAAAAQAALDASTGHAVTIRGVARGDCRIRAGTPIDVGGVSPSLRGRYVVSESVHTVDATGYRTAFSSEPPPPPPRPVTAGSSITLGRVVDVDDPDQLGRVRVVLPAHADVDVGWLGVLCAGAGPDRGILALPDVDDTVVVALPHGVPEHGIVLGALYGTVSPPDPGVVGGAVRRWSLHTADGQSIVLDDDEHRIRIRNRAGSFVELAPDVVRLHAATDLVLEAPGHAITVRAKTVDFAQATAEESGGPDGPGERGGG